MTVPTDARPYLDAVRLEAGRRAGLPDKWAKLVRGDSVREVEVHAAEIARFYEHRLWQANRHLIENHPQFREV